MEGPCNPRETWLKVWRNTNFDAILPWDTLCELVHDLLISLIRKNLRGKMVLEMGSGTGRVSLRLAKDGANVMLLDISSDAIKFSRSLFKSNHINGTFILGDIFLPPFKHDVLDFVWSSGVLEHFTLDRIGAYLDDSLAILRKNGSLVVIVPNKRAFVYNLFRRLDMRLGRWKFGHEEPLSSKELYLFHSKPVAHRSSGLVCQFRYCSLPILGYLLNLCLRVLLTHFRLLSTIDKKVPGYLIAGVWRKGSSGY